MMHRSYLALHYVQTVSVRERERERERDRERERELTLGMADTFINECPFACWFEMTVKLI